MKFTYYLPTWGLGSLVSFHFKPQQLLNLNHNLYMSARQNQFPSFSSQNMPIPDFRRNVLERNRTVREREKRGNSPLTRHLQKVYPIGIHKSNSSSPLSSLSLSQNSNDSLISSSILWDSKISEPFHLLGRFERREATSAYEPFHGHGPFERREAQVAKVSFSGHGSFKRRETPAAEDGKGSSESKDGNLKRCHWITKGSGKFSMFLYFGIRDVGLYSLGLIEWEDSKKFHVGKNLILSNAFYPNYPITDLQSRFRNSRI